MNEADVSTMIVAAYRGGARPSQIATALSGLIINVVDGEHGARAAAMMLEVRSQCMLAEQAAAVHAARSPENLTTQSERENAEDALDQPESGVQTSERTKPSGPLGDITQ